MFRPVWHKWIETPCSSIKFKFSATLTNKTFVFFFFFPQLLQEYFNIPIRHPRNFLNRLRCLRRIALPLPLYRFTH